MKSKKGTNVLIGLAVQLQILLVLRKIQWIKLVVSRQFSIQHGGWRKNGTIGKLTSRTGSTTRWLDLDTIVIVGLGAKGNRRRYRQGQENWRRELGLLLQGKMCELATIGVGNGSVLSFGCVVKPCQVDQECGWVDHTWIMRLGSDCKCGQRMDTSLYRNCYEVFWHKNLEFW